MINDEILEKSRQIQGRMNELANSVDILLGTFLKKNNISSKMLGDKIKQLQIYFTNNDIGDENNLIFRLKKFNSIWIFMKHGFLVHGATSFTFQKDGEIKTITEKEFEELCNEFTYIQKDLLGLK